MTLLSQAIVVVCAAILANYLAKPFKGRWFLRFLILLPWAAPVALGAITWLWIFDGLYSVINWVLVHAGLIGPACGLLHQWPFRVGECTSLNTPQWLGQENLGMASIITVQAWRVLPFAVVIFLAGHASIPQEVEDAAKVDGATGIKKLVYVTLPLQLPIALVAVLFGLIFTATDMAVVYILTNGGPFNSTQVITTWAFQTGIQGGSLGEGAAVSLFLLPVLAVVAITMLIFAQTSRGRVMTLRLREKVTTYLVVGAVRDRARVPVLLDAHDGAEAVERSAQRAEPAVLVPPGSDLGQRPEPLRHELSALARQHGDRRRRRGRDHARARAAGRYALARLTGKIGGDARHRDLPDLPRAADAALPAALARDLESWAAGFALVADRRLPVVHDSVCDVADDGILQDDPT